MTLTIKNVHLVDGRGRKGKVDIVIESHCIKEVGKGKDGRKVIQFKKDVYITPAFFDAHTHLASFGLSLTRPRLDNLRSKKEALEIVREEVRKEEKLPVIFDGFDESKWEEKELPIREELDMISKKVPIILRRVCGHMAVLNTKALSLLPSKVKGVDFEKGFAKEYVPLNLNKIFPPPLEEWKRAILRAQEVAIVKGIGGVGEFGCPERFKAYQELRREGKLKLRVYFSFYLERMKELIKLGIFSGLGDDSLKIGGIKIFVDGSVGARTASFFKPYRSGEEPPLLSTKEKMKKILREAEQSSLQLIFHTIGDRAIREVLEAMKESIQPSNPLRHRIEHFEFPSPFDIEEVEKMQIVVSMQPNFILQWGSRGGMYEEALGEERWRASNPIGSILKRNLHVAFGSDCMPLDPIIGIKGALSHPVEKERISYFEALECYTKGSAFACLFDSKFGHLKEGNYADLLFFDRDPSIFPDTPPFAVLLKGEFVFPPGGLTQETEKFDNEKDLWKKL